MSSRSPGGAASRRDRGIRSTPPPSPMGGLHADYESRLRSPAGGRRTSSSGSPKPNIEAWSSPNSSSRARGGSPLTLGLGLTQPSPRRGSSGGGGGGGGGGGSGSSGGGGGQSGHRRSGSAGSSNERYSDRFIPSRTGSQLDTSYSLIDDNNAGGNNNGKNSNQGGGGGASGASSSSGGAGGGAAGGAGGDGTRESLSTYSMLLKTELLGVESGANRYDKAEDKGAVTSPARNLFRFKIPRRAAFDEATKPYSLSPVGHASRRLLSSPRKAKRKIAKVPFKVLDAPALQDDFYLNLVDWSALNVLAVGLGSCVYLWSACTSKVTKLCDLGPDDLVTSVSWTQRGTHLAVGTSVGEVQIWDAAKCKKVRMMEGHSGRVGTLAWNHHTLASGSRDRLIYQRDVRVSQHFVSKLVGHKQEVCGLKWSCDDTQLASGGNDNKLLIWNVSSQTPIMRFNDHTAAVKAIAWSPHQHGLLASGGGTADRCIRFWNTLTGTPLNCIDTGSQVCNLMWSKNINEVVSTHGYSLNQIIVWRYPSMTKVATLTGHTYRVLYLALSPDGQTIVTGAGDETLRFWNVFPGPKNKSGSRLGTSLLFPSGADIR